MATHRSLLLAVLMTAACAQAPQSPDAGACHLAPVDCFHGCDNPGQCCGGACCNGPCDGTSDLCP